MLHRNRDNNVKCKLKQSNKQYLNQNALLTHLPKSILPKTRLEAIRSVFCLLSAYKEQKHITKAVRRSYTKGPYGRPRCRENISF